MTTYLTSKCHCGKNTFKIPLDTEKIPLHIDTCHCNPCRHVTGQMNVHCVPLKGSPLSATAAEGVDSPANLDSLIQYNTTAIGTRYFCGNCSAHMFIYLRLETGPQFFVMSGTLDKVEGIAAVTDHIFVEDTLDGGLADHLRTDNGKEIQRYVGWIGSKEVPVGWKSEKLENKGDVETLPFFCRCKAIQFHLTRAKEIQDRKTQYWLVPGEKEGDPIKFIAAHCLCSDCRLASGNVVQSWIVAPHANIIDSNTGEPVVVEAGEKRMKGLKSYESSPGTYRDFCETCGANVFWWTNKQSSRLCVAAGLIDEEAQGVRAEKWLHWHDKILHGKDSLTSYTEADLVDGTKKTKEGK